MRRQRLHAGKPGQIPAIQVHPSAPSQGQLCAPKAKGQHVAGSRLGSLEQSPSLDDSGIRVLGRCSVPSFHGGYYWYSPVRAKTERESLEATRKGGGGLGEVPEAKTCEHLCANRKADFPV